MKLVNLEWPDFGPLEAAPEFAAEDHARRIGRVRGRMEELGVTHLAVYGDREHCANLLWLAGFDPRFEEALLIVGREGLPLVLTGIECEQYLRISPLFRAGGLRQARCAEFSLAGISATGEPLAALLRGAGLDERARVACAGWKSVKGHDTPAWIVEALRDVGGAEPLNATGLFTDPDAGLRTTVDARELAWFEHANRKSAAALRRVVFALRPGAVDFDLLAAAGYDGSPVSCDWGLKSGAGRISLASPRGAVVAEGEALTVNLGYRGANICRAGIVAREDRGGYVREWAGPFVAVMQQWLAGLQIGRAGGELTASLPWTPGYAPGHLIHYEEWLETPFRPGSDVRLRSGMLIQSDISPSSPVHGPARFEDGYALAGEELRRELAGSHPAVLDRCLARRRMMEALGYHLPPDVLPLSDVAGLVAPLLLDPGRVLASS